MRARPLFARNKHRLSFDLSQMAVLYSRMRKFLINTTLTLGLLALVVTAQEPDSLKPGEKSKHDAEKPAPSAVEAGLEDAVDFKTLKETVLNRKPPPIYGKVEDLDGKIIRIVGFMGPYDDFENLRNFMLFNKPVGCNFCAPPSVKEVVFVRQKAEKAKFIDEPVLVEGTMKLWREDSEDEGHHNGFLYVMEDAKVEVYKPKKAN